MIIRSDTELAAARQLAADLNCSPENFFIPENTVTSPAIVPGRRAFTETPPFFRAASMGMGAVISADKTVENYTRLLSQSKRGTDIFSAAAVAALNRELFAHGFCIGVLNCYYLPRSPFKGSRRADGIELRVFEREELTWLYSFKEFENALIYRNEGERRDILAVCAINGRNIMGVAGACADSPLMAQIGVDVLPEYRGMGVGAALVSACAGEIMRAGFVPYYGLSCGNIFSMRLAAACGFTPAWCEMFSVKI